MRVLDFSETHFLIDLEIKIGDGTNHMSNLEHENSDTSTPLIQG